MADKLTNIIGDATVGGVSRFLDPNDKNFTNIIFQQGKPPLDSEHNMIQQMQNYLRKEFIRSVFKSGFVTSPTITYGTNEITFSTESKLLVDGNLITIPASKAISLSSPPGSGTRTDLLFLEVFYEEVAPTGSPETDDETIYTYGDVSGDSGTETNNIKDTVVGDETTRRVQLRFRFREVTSVDFSTYPKGMDDTANVNAQGGLSSPNASYTFSFPNSDDEYLSRSGSGDNTSGDDLDVVDGYSYAFPIFKITRTTSSTMEASMLEYIKDETESVFRLGSSGSTEVAFASYENNTTLGSDSSSVTVGISQFDPTKDLIMAYSNSVYLKKGVDFTVSGTGATATINKPSGTWDLGTEFDFVVFKNTTVATSIDGSIIDDGTVAESKLATALQTKINSGASDSDLLNMKRAISMGGWV